MRRLPPVLCFHAKRFEHHLAGGGRKLDTPLLCALISNQGRLRDDKEAPSANAIPQTHSHLRLSCLLFTDMIARPSWHSPRTSASYAHCRVVCRFPLDDLDLTPFLSSSVLRNRYGLRMRHQTATISSGGSECNGATEAAEGRPPALYQLYAVVCHHGQMEGGHYVAYLRWAPA